MKRMVVILVAMLVLTTVSCGVGAGEPAGSGTSGVAESTASEPAVTVSCPYLAGMDIAPDVYSAPGDDVFYSSLTDFTAELFSRAAADGKNTLISPMSVMFAMAPAEIGAKGTTLSEMFNVLGGICPATHVSQLVGLCNSYDGSDTLSIANGIWYRDGRLDPGEDFVYACGELGAPVTAAPFDSSTVDEINGWVEENTGGMIDRILDRIEDNITVYLVNAMAFESHWDEAYPSHMVRDGVFRSADGTVSSAKMMYSREYGYIDTAGVIGFEKSYSDPRFSFMAVMPKDEDIAIDVIAEGLTGDLLREIIGGVQAEPVSTAIPKFTGEYSADLCDELAEMGMPTAFSYGADFSGMGDGGEELFIGQVIHRTFISVDEAGTDAGAVTLIEMPSKSADGGEEVNTVVLDRPFLYMIVDTELQIPVFIGCVRNM